MLSAETTKALDEALSAVIEEAGDSPEYADLVDHLEKARTALPEGDEKPDADPKPPAAEDDEDEEPADDEDEADKDGPPDNFDEAKRRFIAQRKGE